MNTSSFMQRMHLLIDLHTYFSRCIATFLLKSILCRAHFSSAFLQRMVAHILSQYRDKYLLLTLTYMFPFLVSSRSQCVGFSVCIVGSHQNVTVSWSGCEYDGASCFAASTKLNCLKEDGTFCRVRRSILSCIIIDN